MIDDEIQDALNVSPSPEFLARVRTRIASEPQPSPWRPAWTVAAVGVLAAMLLIAVVFSKPKRENPAAPEAVQALRPLSAIPVVSGVPPLLQSSSAELRRGRTEAQSAKAGGRTVPPPSTQPEILLDPAETLALRALIDGVREGRVDLSAAQRSTAPLPMALEPVTTIVIAPITIEPIAPTAGAEGVRP